MAKPAMKNLFGIGIVCAASLFVSGCVSDDYDLDNVDLTMAFGSDGLGVKLGTTEKITLDKMLDVDQTVKTDQTNLYYLVKSGGTDFNVNVNEVMPDFDGTLLDITRPVLEYSDVKEQIESTGHSVAAGEAVPVSAGFELSGPVDGKESIDFTLEDVNDIEFLSNVHVKQNELVVRIEKENTPKDLALEVTSLKNVCIYLPEFLQVASVSSGWTYDKAKHTISCSEINYSASNPDVCHIYFTDLTPNKAPKDGKIELSKEECKVRLTCGEVKFKNTSGATINMNEGNVASVNIDIVLKDKVLDIETVTGRFNQVIDPEVEPITVGDDLPSYLTDENVKLNMSNPTIRFAADLTNIPVNVDMGGELTSVFKSAPSCSVTLPTTNIRAKEQNTVYYYQGSAPYDPERNSEAGDITAETPNLGTLISAVPERIDVDFAGGKLKVDNTKEATIELGRSYAAHTDYTVFVPFTFNGEVNIVYNDSTNSINSDVKDLSAKGVRLSATVDNTIPLELAVHAEAFDVNGRKLDGITFVDPSTQKDARAAASSDGITAATTELTLDADLSDPSDLSKIDRIYFRISAASDTSNSANRQLLSTQYLQFKDIRVRLKGQVTADLN